jgi:hypothetical protein
LGVPAHICAVGLYFRGCRRRFACHPPPKTEPCCVPFGHSASLRPKGSLSLTRKLKMKCIFSLFLSFCAILFMYF